MLRHNFRKGFSFMNEHNVFLKIEGHFYKCKHFNFVKLRSNLLFISVFLFKSLAYYKVLGKPCGATKNF